jgi:hypothetical protein
MSNGLQFARIAALVGKQNGAFTHPLEVGASWLAFFSALALIIWTAHRVRQWREDRVPNWTDVLDRADALLNASAQRRAKG